MRLKVSPKAAKLSVKPEEFVPFLKQIFGQKRKTLANNLKGKYLDSSIKAAFAEAGLRPDVRAEAVPIEGLAHLFLALQ